VTTTQPSVPESQSENNEEKRREGQRKRERERKTKKRNKPLTPMEVKLERRTALKAYSTRSNVDRLGVKQMSKKRRANPYQLDTVCLQD
jgi:hypothetical protein